MVAMARHQVQSPITQKKEKGRKGGREKRSIRKACRVHHCLFFDKGTRKKKKKKN
jgi:hypothetical protein